MLTSLLPGFRELRAPLAAGGLLLLAVWLLVEPELPDQPTGILASLDALGGLLGPLATGTAVAFGAYLVGSVWTTASRSAWQNATRWWTARTNKESLEKAMRTGRDPGWATAELERFEDMSSGTKAALGKHTGDAVRLAQRKWEALGNGATEKAGQSDLVPEVFGDAGVSGDIRTALSTGEGWRPFESERFRLVQREFPLIRRRLLATHPDVFNEIDRLRSEADLRGAIALPLLLVGIALWIRVGLLSGAVAFLVAGIFAVILGVEARAQRIQAGDALVDSLVTGLVTAPALERLGESTDRITGDLARPTGLPTVAGAFSTKR